MDSKKYDIVVNPLVSICLITYNHQEFIAESINSVLNQTYTNWELIIIDNASTDNTREVIENYIEDCKNITFLPQSTNSYVSCASNLAINTCKGEYIVLLSGDDIFYPTKIERQLQFMQKRDLELSFTWMNAIDSMSKNCKSKIQDWFNCPTSKTRNDIFLQYFSMHNITYAPTVMIKTCLLNNIPLFDHRLLQTQDMELWIRLLKKTNKVQILHEKLTFYRVLDSGTNLSLNKDSRHKNRTDFEMLYVWKELFSIDMKDLSSIFGIAMDDKNKYQIIYSHLKSQDIFVWQYAMLVDMYSHLGDNCDSESPIFQLFFEEYGNFMILPSENKSLLSLEKELESCKHTIGLRNKELAHKGTLGWFVREILKRVKKISFF